MAMLKRGYNIILLRDCTTALESAYTLEDESMTEHTVYQVEMMFGVSATGDDLMKGSA